MSMVKGKLQDMFWDLGDQLGFFFFKEVKSTFYSIFQNSKQQTFSKIYENFT